MRRWAGQATAPPLDSRLTFAILPPILRLAPLRPETRQAACTLRSQTGPVNRPSTIACPGETIFSISNQIVAINSKNLSFSLWIFLFAETLATLLHAAFNSSPIRFDTLQQNTHHVMRWLLAYLSKSWSRGSHDKRFSYRVS